MGDKGIMMKQFLHWAILPVLMLLLTGCLVRALNPWLSDATKVKDIPLTGVWYDEKSDVAAFFATDGSNYRLMVVNDRKETACYVASLHRLDGKLLLEVGPDTHQDMNITTLPACLLFRVEMDKDSLQIYNIDAETFDKQITASKIAGAVSGNKKDGFVINAPTEDLTAFITAKLKEANFFYAKPMYQFRKISMK